MSNGSRLTEPEVLPRTVDGAMRAMPGGEGERLLAAALAAALVEYRRQVQKRGGDAEVAGPAPEWRLLTRWEQMAASARNGGRGRS